MKAADGDKLKSQSPNSRSKYQQNHELLKCRHAEKKRKQRRRSLAPSRRRKLSKSTWPVNAIIAKYRYPVSVQLPKWDSKVSKEIRKFIPKQNKTGYLILDWACFAYMRASLRARLTSERARGKCASALVVT